MLAVSATQMAAVDVAMVEVCGLETMQVMEAAGLAVAQFARGRFLAGDPRGKRVLVMCGSGGNGGDGLVAARYLQGWGALCEIWLSSRPSSSTSLTAHQLRITELIGLPLHIPGAGETLPAADLILDALLGFSLAGAPSGAAATLIRAANDHPAPVLAVDLPSGLDATSGEVYDPCIVAAATLTLALPKTGLLVPGATAVTGELVVADIGVPPAAWAAAGLDPGQIFATAPFLPVI